MTCCRLQINDLFLQPERRQVRSRALRGEWFKSTERFQSAAVCVIPSAQDKHRAHESRRCLSNIQFVGVHEISKAVMENHCGATLCLHIC